MHYRAIAALPFSNREQAVARLRDQLRVMALAGGGRPDWSSLVVEGPTEAPGPRGRTWFEWSATVVSDGGRDLVRHHPVDDDLLVPAARGPVPGATMPQPSIR
jgi:hypothetical protein